MSFVRHFTLINSVGEEYDITNKQVLLSEPSGLGIKRDNNYRRVGNRFYLLSKRRAQENFKGVVNFTPPDAYIKYNEFVEFLSKEPLKLRYKPIDNYDYYKYRGVFPKWDYVFYQNVMIGSLSKQDLTKYGSLECQLELTPLTPWYRSLYLTSEDKEHKPGVVWERTSTFTWEWETNDVKRLRFDADCHIPSPIKVMIPGPAVHPSWRHYVDNTLVREGSIDCVVPVNHNLVIDNTSDTFRVVIETTGGEYVRNVYQDCDFSKDKFIEVQNGSNVISATFTETDNNSINAEVMLFYESV